MDRIRVLRVIEYEGPRDLIEKMISSRSLKGEQKFNSCVLREAIIGELPAILDVKVDPKL